MGVFLKICFLFMITSAKKKSGGQTSWFNQGFLPRFCNAIDLKSKPEDFLAVSSIFLQQGSSLLIWQRR